MGDNPEIKLNKNEYAKLEKDVLDVIEDIYGYAKTGFDSITVDDVVKVAIGVTTIFRDYGYREKRHQARRLSVPVGRMSAQELEELARLSDA
jgi:ferredoxin-nitrite reductase